MKLSVFKVLTGKSKSSKSYANISGNKSYDITKKQYKEIKKKACPWKFTVVESPSSTSYLAREVLVYSYIQNNGIQQLKFQNKNGQKISTQTQLPFYFSKPFTISNEFYYYEIKVIKNNNNSKIYFGLGISSYIFTELPGTTLNTVCYHSSGLIYAAGSVVAYAKVVNEGDVVGIGYYPSNGNIFFTLNGDFIQTISGSILNRQRFYPHLGSDGECILEVNFGLNHFLYTPEESNKYLTTEELNKKNIKKNENERTEEDLNTTLFNDSFSTLPRVTVTTPGSSRINAPSSVDATNNASYIENVNKKTTGDNVDFFESIDNTNSNYTSNTQKNSSSTIFSPFSDSSSSKFNSLPSSSSTLFNSSSNSNNNNFGLNNKSSLFTIKEDDSKDNTLIPFFNTNTNKSNTLVQFSSNDTNKSNALVPFSSNDSNKSNALVPFSNTSSNTMSLINTNNSSNPFLIYNNNNTSYNNNISYNNNTSFNNSINNNYNGFMNNNSYNSFTTPLSYNPNNPFNDMMNNTNVNNSNLLANTSFNSSYSNNNTNNFNTFGTFNNGNNNSMGTSSSFGNSNTFNSSNPFSNYNLNSSSNTFGNNGFTNTSNNNALFSSSSSINNSLLPNNTLSKSWTPSSSLTTSLATSQSSFNALTTTSLTTPMLTITRSMTLADKAKNTSFASLGMNTDSKHLSINNIISTSSSLNINNTITSTGNNLSEKSFEIDTKQTSPILSNLSSSNLSSPINSPFGSSFNSLSFSGSPNPLNTNTINNDLTNSNANILSSINKDSSFSISNSSITRSKTFAGTSSNGTYGVSQSNIFNMNNLMNVNTAIKDELNSKNQSPISTPTTPIFQNTGTSLGKSPYSNPFSTPLSSNSPSSYGNPFGTPSNEIRPLSLGASPIQSSNLSFHMPIIPNNTVTTHNTGTSYHTSWDNSFNNSLNNSFVLNTNTTSTPMVTTNLTGVKSIHSSSNPFEGIQ